MAENDKSKILPIVSSQEREKADTSNESVYKEELENSFETQDYEKQTHEIRQSQKQNTLTGHTIYRWGICLLFGLVCIFCLYLSGIFMYLIWHYCKLLLSNPQELEEFLR